MKKSIMNLIRHAEVSEKVIEKYLAAKVKGEGGLCLKYSNPNESGYPDRLVLTSDGKVRWVEIKSKGKRPTLLQEARHQALRRIGHTVYVVDSKEEVDKLLAKWKGGEV